MQIIKLHKNKCIADISLILRMNIDIVNCDGVITSGKKMSITFQAKHHFLVLPRESFATLKSLKVEHVALLKHMDVIGREIAEKLVLRLSEQLHIRRCNCYCYLDNYYYNTSIIIIHIRRYLFT